ncbi:hypothetical protein IF1G_05565 [Cordyceps javanica]|uniref:Uncharacterized protein n=1 Tax=Cordyceps javanica TaxID=43265 RepID=A0A545V210_9HYPO|nr:hypothetical protein IF1G_05565 [Cordyceps javanica]
MVGQSSFVTPPLPIHYQTSRYPRLPLQRPTANVGGTRAVVVVGVFLSVPVSQVTTYLLACLPMNNKRWTPCKPCLHA